MSTKQLFNCYHLHNGRALFNGHLRASNGREALQQFKAICPTARTWHVVHAPQDTRRITDAHGFAWMVQDNSKLPGHAPANRRFWISRPAHCDWSPVLSGVVGFYAATLDDARTKLSKREH